MDCSNEIRKHVENRLYKTSACIVELVRKYWILLDLSGILDCGLRFRICSLSLSFGWSSLYSFVHLFLVGNSHESCANLIVFWYRYL